MSTPIDVAQYYPSYVNPNPAIAPEQFQSIQASWQIIHSGDYALFKKQTLIADPVGFWGLKFYDILLELDPSLKSLFSNKFQQGKMLTDMVDAALSLLPGSIDQMLGQQR